MDPNPYAAPEALLDGDPDGELHLREVAGAQRRLLLSILVSLGANVLLRSGDLAAWILIPVALAVAAFSIFCVYRLCRALGTSPALWVVAMFIPLLNLLALVILNQRATTFLKARGVAVGLLGADL